MRRPDSRPSAVVVGLDCITGLQSARLLAARDVPVIGIVEDRRHFCATTRVARRIVSAPTAGEPLIRALQVLARQLPLPGYAFLLPCTDAAVLAISQFRDRLDERYRFVLPDHDVIVRLMDKVGFAEHAQRHGLPIPPTAILRTRRDALAAQESLDFPAVLKPALKTPRWLRNVGAKAIRINHPAELLPHYDELARWSDVLVAQTWIEGTEDDLYSSNMYFARDGSAAVSFIARKIRQWPLDTGTSSLGVEVRNDTVRDIALELFRSVGYRGLAYLEVKRDRGSRRYAIIEPNVGRPTGRSAIAERGGVEYLLTAYCDAVGLALPDAREQQYRGVKWIYWRHDLQAALVRFNRGELTPADWWRSVRGPSIEAVGSLRDPMPFVADLAHTGSAIVRRLRARRQ